jgi:TRAP-type C4-dicarboxylate transport system permease small subunit
VVMRYFFRSPHEWFDEIMIHACVLAIFLACGNATWLRKHITLELLYVHLKGKWRRLADIIHFTAVIVLSVMVVIFSIRWGIFVDSQGAKYQTAIGTPWSFLTYVMALGFALNGIYGSGLLLRACAGIGYEETAQEKVTTG